MNNVETIENSVVTDQIITLKGIHKVRKFKIQATKDRNGRWLGGVKNVNSNGDIILTEEEKNSGNYYLSIDDIVEVYDGMQLDLSDNRDAAVWEMIKHSPFIAESREAADKAEGREFYVYIQGVESSKNVSKKKLRFKAERFIFEDTQEGIYKHARLLNHDMRGFNPSEVTEFLLGVASNTPEKIINVYENPAMVTKLFLLDAIEARIINYTNGVYTYDSGEQILTMGISENQAIEWLRESENKKMVEMIKSQVYPEYSKKKTTKSE